MNRPIADSVAKLEQAITTLCNDYTNTMELKINHIQIVEAVQSPKSYDDVSERTIEYVVRVSVGM